MAPPDFVMTLEPGIEWMLFDSVTLQTAPLVVFPSVFCLRVMRHIAPVMGVTFLVHDNNWRVLGEARA